MAVFKALFTAPNYAGIERWRAAFIAKPHNAFEQFIGPGGRCGKFMKYPGRTSMIGVLIHIVRVDP